MPSNVEVLKAEVLPLPVADRARLVERRRAQLENGATKLRPGPETLAKPGTDFR